MKSATNLHGAETQKNIFARKNSSEVEGDAWKYKQSRARNWSDVPPRMTLTSFMCVLDREDSHFHCHLMHISYLILSIHRALQIKVVETL